jgi:hypothetical protein
MKKNITNVLTLFVLVALLLVSVYFTYNLVVKQGAVVGSDSWLQQKGTQTQGKASLFTDASGKFSFTYPSAWRPSQGDSMVVPGGNEPITVHLPPVSTLLTPWLSIASVSLPTEKNPLITYDSCCSGKKYWFAATTSRWVAVSFSQSDDVQANVDGALEKITPLPLNKNGACLLVQTYGSRNFVHIETGDEGYPPVVHYYVMGDKGSVAEFNSIYDFSYLHPDALTDVKYVRDVLLPSFSFAHENVAQVSCR